MSYFLTLALCIFNAFANNTPTKPTAYVIVKPGLLWNTTKYVIDGKSYSAIPFLEDGFIEAFHQNDEAYKAMRAHSLNNKISLSLRAVSIIMIVGSVAVLENRHDKAHGAAIGGAGIAIAEYFQRRSHADLNRAINLYNGIVLPLETVMPKNPCPAIICWDF